MTIHAHPDDEASKGAGTVARYGDQGVRTSLVCCTGGEEGDILNPAMDSPDVRDRLAEVRMEELAASIEICGYSAAYLLGYRDSGMPQTEANAHPDAFANAESEEAVRRLVQVIRAERPQVILAYDEHKQYPHPDHVRAHEISMLAFDRAGAGAFGPELGDPWQPLKLYWFHWSYKRIRSLHDEFLERDIESPFGAWIEGRDDWDHRVTTQIPVGEEEVGVARDALRAHATQISPEAFWLQLPDDVVADTYPYEDFVLVRNLTRTQTSEGTPESDLFAGIE